MSKELKTSIAEAHSIALQIYHENRAKETIDSILKSLGLYWRTWPEEKPEMGQDVIIKYWHTPTNGQSLWIIEEGSLLNETTWRQLQGEEVYGWIPMEALKVLP